jgi:multidrug efflux pump subunit AcrB
MNKVPAASSSMFRFTTERPVALIMTVLAIAVFGSISYQRLSLSLMPDISYPSITVRTQYPGSAPQEVETVVSRPIEQALGVVNKLVSISSISKAEMSDVVLEFNWDADMNAAIQNIREQLDQIRFPPEIERPLILRYDPSLDPVMRLGLYGEADLFVLRLIAEEDLKRDLETIPGVAAAKVKGGLEEEIRIEIDESVVTTLNIDIAQVAQRMAQENVNLAGGELREGETIYLVRTLNEFKNLDEIRDITIGFRNSAPVRLRDIGTVQRTNKDREVMTRMGGTESVEIEIYKEADANIVLVAKAVRNAVFGTEEQQAYVNKPDSVKAADAAENMQQKNQQDQLEAQMTNFIAYRLAEGIELEVLSDQSTFIEEAVNEVKQTAVIGGLLAVLVLFLFLRMLVPTLIIALAIPVSIITTFGPLYLYEVTLNIMSLGGLALGIGMLVDNSIVVLESITRFRETGESVQDSAVHGVSQVGPAVIASTLTTIAVFFPLVFVEGVAGQAFGDMSLAVVFSLLASLMVALFLIPMLSSRHLAGIQDSDKATRLGVLELSTIAPFVARLRKQENDDTTPLSPMLYLRSFLGIPVEMIARILWTLLSLLWSALKGTVVLLTVPVIVIVSLFWRPITVLRRTLLENVFQDTEWKGVSLRVFASADTYVAPGRAWERCVGFDQWLSRFTLVKRIALQIVPGIVVSLYILISALLFLVVEITTKLLFHLLLLTGIICIAVIAEAAFIIVPLVYPLLSLFERCYGVLASSYTPLLQLALRNRLAVVMLAFIPLGWCIFSLTPKLGSELIPEVHQGEFHVEYRQPVGTQLDQTAESIHFLERLLLDDPRIQTVATVIGSEQQSTRSSDEGEHSGRLTAILKPTDNPILTEEEVIRDTRRRLADAVGMEWKITKPVLFSFKAPIEIEVRGFNLATLYDLSMRVQGAIQNVDGLTDIRASIQQGNPEVQIQYNRNQLSQYGLNIREVARLVQNKVLGNVPTRFRQEERSIDIRVRLQEHDKQSIDQLSRLTVNPGANIPIPLESVANINIKDGPSEIRRIDRQRVGLITANVSGIDLGTAISRINQSLESVSHPPDFSFSVTGQNREMETSLNSLVFALGLAVFLIYVIMASQFESFVQPLVIMLTIPLALIGVIMGLYLFAVPVSIVVFIGLIMLAGIVVNNAIVLVDYINQARQSGMAKAEAIIHAGKIRLRPILMTTSTTVLGLLPMALALGEGAEIRTPMALTVICGLLSSTILTLVIVPVVYSLVDLKE